MPTGSLEHPEESYCLLVVPTLDPGPHFKIRLHQRAQKTNSHGYVSNSYWGRGAGRARGYEEARCKYSSFDFSTNNVYGSNETRFKFKYKILYQVPNNLWLHAFIYIISVNLHRLFKEFSRVIWLYDSFASCDDFKRNL